MHIHILRINIAKTFPLAWFINPVLFQYWSLKTFWRNYNLILNLTWKYESFRITKLIMRKRAILKGSHCMIKRMDES